MSEPLFDSAAAALTFAYHYSSQQYAATPMSKMLKGQNIGGGKGLGGLDGAAQAAYVQGAVNRMLPIERACLIARYSPKSEPCTCGSACCSGEKISQAYREAIEAIRDWSFITAPASIDRPTREAVLTAYFDNSIKLASEFERRKVPRATGYDAKKRIWDALKTLETDAQNAITKELSWLFVDAG